MALVLAAFLLLFSRYRAGAIPEPAFPLLADAIFSRRHREISDFLCHIRDFV